MIFAVFKNLCSSEEKQLKPDFYFNAASIAKYAGLGELSRVRML